MAKIQVAMEGAEPLLRELSGPAVIGRVGDCDVVVNDTNVSKKHCRIERDEKGWLVIDLGSTNGTLVNGKRVARHLLRDGDVLKVGKATLTFIVQEGAAPRRAGALDEDQAAAFLAQQPSETLAEPDLTDELSDKSDSIAGSIAGESSAASPPLPHVETPAPSAAASAQSTWRRGPALWEQASASDPAPTGARKAINAPAMTKKGMSRDHDVRATDKIALLDRLKGLFGQEDHDDQSKWYRKRLSLPVVIGAAVVLGGILIWRIYVTFSGPDVPPLHSNHSQSTGSAHHKSIND